MNKMGKGQKPSPFFKMTNDSRDFRASEQGTTAKNKGGVGVTSLKTVVREKVFYKVTFQLG